MNKNNGMAPVLCNTGNIHILDLVFHSSSKLVINELDSACGNIKEIMRHLPAK